MLQHFTINSSCLFTCDLSARFESIVRVTGKVTSLRHRLDRIACPVVFSVCVHACWQCFFSFSCCFSFCCFCRWFSFRFCFSSFFSCSWFSFCSFSICFCSCFSSCSFRRCCFSLCICYCCCFCFCMCRGCFSVSHAECGTKGQCDCQGQR